MESLSLINTLALHYQPCNNILSVEVTLAATELTNLEEVCDDKT